MYNLTLRAKTSNIEKPYKVGKFSDFITKLCESTWNESSPSLSHSETSFCREVLVYRLRTAINTAIALNIPMDQIKFSIKVNTGKKISKEDVVVIKKLFHMRESDLFNCIVEYNSSYDIEITGNLFILYSIGGPVFISAILLALREGCLIGDRDESNEKVRKAICKSLLERSFVVMGERAYLGVQLFYTSAYFLNYEFFKLYTGDANGPLRLMENQPVPLLMRFAEKIISNKIIPIDKFYLSWFKTVDESCEFLASQIERMIK